MMSSQDKAAATAKPKNESHIADGADTTKAILTKTGPEPAEVSDAANQETGKAIMCECDDDLSCQLCKLTLGSSERTKDKCKLQTRTHYLDNRFFNNLLIFLAYLKKVQAFWP